jgi:hypothetical protein
MSSLNYSSQMGSLILNYLVSRMSQPEGKITPSKRKSMSNGSESYAKAALDQIFSDALAVYGNIEWPGADLLLLTFSRFMVDTLNNLKGDHSIKLMAIEWIGKICAKLKSLFKDIPPLKEDKWECIKTILSGVKTDVV